MSLTLVTTKIEAWNEFDSLIFTLDSEDKGIHSLKIDTAVTLDSLGELFSSIRAAVELMDREKVIME